MAEATTTTRTKKDSKGPKGSTRARARTAKTTALARRAETGLGPIPTLTIPELSATVDLIITTDGDPLERSLDGTFTDYPVLADGTFASLVVQSRFLKLLAERADTARTDVTDSIEALLMAAGLDETMEKALTLGPFRARISRGLSVTLSKEKLLEQGVSPEQIEKATTRTPRTHVSVTTVKVKT